MGLCVYNRPPYYAAKEYDMDKDGREFIKLLVCVVIGFAMLYGFFWALAAWMPK